MPDNSKEKEIINAIMSIKEEKDSDELADFIIEALEAGEITENGMQRILSVAVNNKFCPSEIVQLLLDTDTIPFTTETMIKVIKNAAKQPDSEKLGMLRMEFNGTLMDQAIIHNTLYTEILEKMNASTSSEERKEYLTVLNMLTGVLESVEEKIEEHENIDENIFSEDEKNEFLKAAIINKLWPAEAITQLLKIGTTVDQDILELAIDHRDPEKFVILFAHYDGDLEKLIFSEDEKNDFLKAAVINTHCPAEAITLLLKKGITVDQDILELAIDNGDPEKFRILFEHYDGDLGALYKKSKEFMDAEIKKSADSHNTKNNRVSEYLEIVFQIHIKKYKNIPEEYQDIVKPILDIADNINDYSNWEKYVLLESVARFINRNILLNINFTLSDNGNFIFSDVLQEEMTDHPLREKNSKTIILDALRNQVSELTKPFKTVEDWLNSIKGHPDLEQTEIDKICTNFLSSINTEVQNLFKNFEKNDRKKIKLYEGKSIYLGMSDTFYEKYNTVCENIISVMNGEISDLIEEKRKINKNKKITIDTEEKDSKKASIKREREEGTLSGPVKTDDSKKVSAKANPYTTSPYPKVPQEALVGKKPKKNRNLFFASNSDEETPVTIEPKKTDKKCLKITVTRGNNTWSYSDEANEEDNTLYEMTAKYANVRTFVVIPSQIIDRYPDAKDKIISATDFGDKESSIKTIKDTEVELSEWDFKYKFYTQGDKHTRCLFRKLKENVKIEPKDAEVFIVGCESAAIKKKGRYVNKRHPLEKSKNPELSTKKRKLSQ